ncbi:calcium-binding protein [Microvirga pudoricolor]|uniref:calcium-binding protein n=1 Tax=Microvirga pudoricolor TaxID=2778729 RepID=UPI00194FED5B|nr:calcium-binding protein [Microvirga pudoricolor]MBM6593038.1 hypothetical protein [Microvirga pudoricolor]
MTLEAELGWLENTYGGQTPVTYGGSQQGNQVGSGVTYGNTSGSTSGNSASGGEAGGHFVGVDESDSSSTYTVFDNEDGTLTCIFETPFGTIVETKLKSDHWFDIKFGPKTENEAEKNRWDAVYGTGGFAVQLIKDLEYSLFPDRFPNERDGGVYIDQNGIRKLADPNWPGWKSNGGDVPDYDVEANSTLTTQLSLTQAGREIRINMVLLGHDAQLALGSSETDYLFGGGGNDTLNGGQGHDRLYGGSDNDLLKGDSANDVLYGDAGNDELWGGTGNDRLDGGSGDDWIAGEEGNDVIEGGAGNDGVCAGIGNDSVNGGADNDTIFGEDGDDFLNGESGNDVISGGNGSDVVWAGLNDDSVKGDAGNDSLWGEEGNDTIIGGTGNDYLRGGDGNDYLDMDAGAAAGADTLDGGYGDDILIGDGVGSVLIGGWGRDTYHIRPWAKTTIADFAAGPDDYEKIIVYKSVFADYAALMSTAYQSGGGTVIAKGEFSLTLSGVNKSTLHLNDFVFI